MRIRLQTDDMKRIMAMCPKMCASSYDAREVLSHICIRLHFDGTGEAIGLDGYAMGICYFPYTMEDGDADEYAFLIDAVKVPSKSAKCTIERNGDDIKVEFDNGQIYLQRVKQSEYIDTDRVQHTDGKTPCLQIAFNPKLLANALMAMKDNEYVYLTFTDRMRAVFIDSENSRAMVLPKRISGTMELDMMRIINDRTK